MKKNVTKWIEKEFLLQSGSNWQIERCWDQKEEHINVWLIKV